MMSFSYYYNLIKAKILGRPLLKINRKDGSIEWATPKLVSTALDPRFHVFEAKGSYYYVNPTCIYKGKYMEALEPELIDKKEEN